jgi:hypothetical protein
MRIRLLDIAHARSGDKGDTGNVGVIARKEKYYPWLAKYLTVERVKKHFKGITLGKVERFEIPNLWALNFLLYESLGGGGTKSLKNDAQGKTLSSAMLRMELDVKELNRKGRSPKRKLKAKAPLRRKASGKQRK